jgi:hypothetical protein
VINYHTFTPLAFPARRPCDGLRRGIRAVCLPGKAGQTFEFSPAEKFFRGEIHKTEMCHVEIHA